MFLRPVLAAACLAAAGALEYCSSVSGDGCETLRVYPSGSAVYLDTGSLGAQDAISLENITGVKQLKYMRRNTSPRKAPGSPLGAKFRNFRRQVLEMRWDDGSKEGVYSGTIPALGPTSTLSYSGHTFFFTYNGEEIARFLMTAGVNMYIIEPASDDAETFASPAYTHAKEEEAFMRRYEEETGYPWLAFYGRDKPVLNMWPAEFLGQTHVVASPHAYTHADGVSEGDLALSLQVLSHAPAGPRVFLVKELLSEFECDHVVELGKKVIRDSMVGQGGGFKSKTRTSRNGWLRRSASPTLERIYKRFGDVLGINHELLSPGKNAEELQVVRYEKSQEYAPHHDFGDDGTPEQRMLTLLLYIDLPEQGGATSDPLCVGSKV
mmetsp:Transcript_5743/g.17958  ORF Transcript_5743/g.17958 Transcript_5743/m.17958 type:complete len:379 (+) Transcript_5743:1559-2695(+)